MDAETESLLYEPTYRVGPTIYATLQEQAHIEATKDLDLLLLDLIAPANKADAMSRLYTAMSRLYVRGVVDGYTQAARDTHPKEAMTEDTFPDV